MMGREGIGERAPMKTERKVQLCYFLLLPTPWVVGKPVATLTPSNIKNIPADIVPTIPHRRPIPIQQHTNW
jgi:hypothetical protein